jgi:hypothetical protein
MFLPEELAWRLDIRMSPIILEQDYGARTLVLKLMAGYRMANSYSSSSTILIEVEGAICGFNNSASN